MNQTKTQLQTSLTTWMILTTRTKYHPNLWIMVTITISNQAALLILKAIPLPLHQVVHTSHKTTATLSSSRKIMRKMFTTLRRLALHQLTLQLFLRRILINWEVASLKGALNLLSPLITPIGSKRTLLKTEALMSQEEITNFGQDWFRIVLVLNQLESNLHNAFKT